jgi:hypothetical protein
MRNVRQLQLALAGLLVLAPVAAASGLRLRAVEGSGMVVSPGAASPRKIVVAAEDDQGHALKDITVRFRLPAEGPSGRFASGLASETVVTGADGRATVLGIAWNGEPGRVILSVTASAPGDAAELEIPIEISGGRAAAGRKAAADGSVNPPSRGSGRKWAIAVAAIGGAAALGLAAKGSHGGSSSTPPVVPPPVTPPVVPPVIGAPVIVISGPGH